MTKKRNFKESSKFVNIPILAIYDEKTNEPVCGRWFGENSLYCRFLLFRHFGSQPVCGFGENIDLYETTSRKLIKPHSDCVIHNNKSE